MPASGRVIGLHLLVEHRQRPEPVRRAKALVDFGLEGDVHGKKQAGSRRQVLMVDRSTLEALSLQPGDLREQITVEFPALDTLPAGTVLRVGEATCEITGPCEPCTHIGQLLGVPDAVAFQQNLQSRRGQLARITAVDGDGFIRIGDAVTVLRSSDLTPV